MGGGKWLIRKSLSIIENTCGINFVLIHNKKIIHLFNTHLEKEEKYTEGLHMASNHQSNYVNSHSRLTDMKFIFLSCNLYENCSTTIHSDRLMSEFCQPSQQGCSSGE